MGLLLFAYSLIDAHAQLMCVPSHGRGVHPPSQPMRLHVGHD